MKVQTQTSVVLLPVTPALSWIDLYYLDIQCNHYHSGTLCGTCTKEQLQHSLIDSAEYHTLHYLPHSNDYLALILPFALAGIALVAIQSLLIACQ